MKARRIESDTHDIIITTEEIRNGERETSRMQLKGSLKKQGDVHILSYQENLGHGQESLPVLSTITIHPGQHITLQRAGRYSSSFVFEPDKRHDAVYQTPYGNLSLGVTTKNALFHTHEDFSDLHLHYLLDNGQEILSEHHMKIEIKKRKDTP